MRRAVAALGVLLAVAVACMVWWVATPAGVTDASVEPASLPQAARDREEVHEPVEPSAFDGPVECNLSSRVGYAQLTEMKGQEELGPLSVTAMRDWVRFTPRRNPGAGWLVVDGYEPALLGWVDDGCLDVVELVRVPTGTVVVKLLGMVTGVGYSLTSGRFGSFAEDETEMRIELSAGEQSVAVHAMFGEMRLEGPEVVVDVQVGEEVVVALEVPALPLHGWSLLEVEDGFRVMALVPSAAAATSGVEVGDRIYEVDGASASELVAAEVQWEEGPLALRLRRGDEDLALTVGP